MSVIAAFEASVLVPDLPRNIVSLSRMAAPLGFQTTLFAFINAFVFHPANVFHSIISSLSVFDKEEKSDLFSRSELHDNTLQDSAVGVVLVYHTRLPLTHFPSCACHKLAQPSALLLFDMSSFVRVYFQRSRLFTR